MPEGLDSIVELLAVTGPKAELPERATMPLASRAAAPGKTGPKAESSERSPAGLSGLAYRDTRLDDAKGRAARMRSRLTELYHFPIIIGILMR